MISKDQLILYFKYILGRDVEGQNEYITKQIGRDPKQYLRELRNSKEFNDKIGRSCDILFIGNCQVHGISSIIGAMSELKTRSIQVDGAQMEKILKGDAYIAADILGAQHIVANFIPPLLREFLVDILEFDVGKIKKVPSIVFSGFHPDMMYLKKDGKLVNRYVGDYQSYIAFRAWDSGLDLDDALSLYNSYVYKKLGYFDYCQESKISLANAAKDQIDLVPMINMWMARREPFMYSVNHPKLFVLEDLAKGLMKQIGVAYTLGVTSHVRDTLADGVVWAVYPEIANHLGFKSSYAFRFDSRTHGLREFLNLSYKNFNTFGDPGSNRFEYTRKGSEQDRIISELIEDIGLIKKEILVPNSTDIQLEFRNLSENPYRRIPHFSFWKRNVVSPDFSQVDPVVRAKFVISPALKVATAGSCFAQHISKTLVKHGLNYYVPESGAELSEEERRNGHYSVFSARYGNIYTARQLRQLFERAYDI